MKDEIISVEQGGDAWLRLKLGVISASNVSKVLAKKGTDTRNGYLAELVGQVCTGQMDEALNSKALDFGKNNEAAARAAYEFETGHKVDHAGFIYGKNKRVGCSPDGIIAGTKKGLEIKCPFTSRVHVEFLAMDKIKPEYLLQCQFALWITGFESWDFASFAPKFKTNMLKIHTTEPDWEIHERFENEVGEFISDMDKLLAKLGVSFGEQWK